MEDQEIKFYLVIPTYEPDERFIQLLKEAYDSEQFVIIVVDDGSGVLYQDYFEEAKNYAIVLTHPKNLGKGAALKTAYRYIADYQEKGVVVTADSDGQHCLKDILRVASYCEKHDDTFVLGQRTFQGNVPLKSRLGNAITRYVYYLKTRQHIYDTQTGLRAFSTKYLPFMLAVSGDRFEYEMNVLLLWVQSHPFKELPIETIYLNNNRSTHFRPVKDAYLIYKDLLSFGGVSLLSFLIDYSLYCFCVTLLPATYAYSLLIANTVARSISSLFNYTMNRRYVFKSHASLAKSGSQYIGLAIIIYLLSTSLISGLYALTHFNPYILKIGVDMMLFILSWWVQKHYIFKREMIL